jgi:hypothetical protein
MTATPDCVRARSARSVLRRIDETTAGQIDHRTVCAALGAVDA